MIVIHSIADSDTIETTRVVFGRYEIKPPPPVVLKANQIQILTPDPISLDENITLTIEKKEILKSICHLNTTPVLMLRAQMTCVKNIRQQLHIEGKTFYVKISIEHNF